MKIITNTVGSELLNEEISDPEKSTADITMMDTEAKLQEINVSVSNSSFLGKLEKDEIKRLPNGLTHGFKDDKPALLANGTAGIEEISDDDFHLELEISDDEKQTNGDLSDTSENKLLENSDVPKEKLGSSVLVEVDEVQKVIGVDETQLVADKRMDVVESNNVAVNLNSLLDCEGPTKICSNIEGTAEEECIGSENASGVIEINVVCSEVVVENDKTDANLRKNKTVSVEEKAEENNIVADEVTESNLDSTSENNLSKSSMEVDTDLSVDLQIESFSLKVDNVKSDVDSNNPVSVENVEGKVSSSKEGPIDVETVSESDIDLMEEKLLQSDVTDAVESSESATVTIKPKLSKSPSGDEISLNDVMESVVENFEEQKDSFDDDDDFGNIIIFSPVTEQEKPCSLKEKKNGEISASLESVQTVDNSDEWMVLDELNESFSTDEKTDEESEKICSVNKDKSCEIEEDHESINLDDSVSKNVDVILNGDDIEVHNEEDTSGKVEPLDVCNEAKANINDEERIDAVEENETITSNDIAVTDVEETDTEVLVNIDSVMDVNEDNETTVLDSDETNIEFEDSVPKDDALLNNEEEEILNVDESIPEGDILLNNEEEIMDVDKSVSINNEETIIEESVDENIEQIGLDTDHVKKNVSEVCEREIVPLITKTVSSAEFEGVESNETLKEETDAKIEVNEPISKSRELENELLSSELIETDNILVAPVKSEDTISAEVIDELTSKVEKEESLIKSEDRNVDENKLSKQSNKEVQSVTSVTLEVTGIKESEHSNEGSKSAASDTIKEIEGESDSSRKRLASDPAGECEKKKLKSDVESQNVPLPDSVCEPVGNVDSTESKLKRSNSDVDCESDVVKRPKLCSDDNLTVCSDVVEECLRFVETNSVSDKILKKVPEVKNNSDSDVSYIRNILKSAIDTTDKRKGEKDKPKKETVSSKSKENVKKAFTNLDLAIERVVEGSSKNPDEKIPLLKRFHKNQLKHLTRHDLEELVVVKLCEAITDRSVIGELRLRCQKAEQIHDQWRKKALQLEKSHRELEMVLKRYLQEAANTKKERQPLPIKVTRSVGLQVVLATSVHGNLIRQKYISGSSQISSRKQGTMPNKTANSSTQKSHPPIVDLHSPSKSPAQTTRTRPSISTPNPPVTPAPSPKQKSLEVIDLTDKEEKNKQLQQKQQQLTQQQQQLSQQQQQQQQQKLKQQIIQQQQQQKLQKQQLIQQKQIVQQNQQQVKQQLPLQKVQKQLPQKPQPQATQQNLSVRVPTSSVPQSGLRLVQTHQLTTNPTAQGMAILVPTSAQNGTNRPPQLFIAASPASQLRTTVPAVIQQNRSTTSANPLNINGNSTVMLRTGQVIPIQQTNAGVQLRSPPAALPIISPRAGIQQIRQPLQTVYKHPAPLPLNPQHAMKPGVKLPPPKPQLKIAKTVNGIMLSWSMAVGKDVADIASYQLFAYQESSQAPSTALWKKVGDVKALPLPMACTLTQFVEGHKYHFSVRAVDIHSRIGPFSVPGSILLTSGK